MSETDTSTASGSFAPINFGPVRTDEAFDLENLSEEEREVVTADEFVIFGQANIEQFDDPEPGDEPIYILMEALEENLDQFHELGNISRRHKDVRVGEPLREYSLGGDTSIHLDSGETLRFDAGDTLRTEVIREGEPLPDGSGQAEQDALWLVANIFGRDDPGGSRISQQTRLAAYYGHLDGFSVTIDKLELEPTADGHVVHDVDFLACTIGEDDLIKNKGSTFGVAEFQMLFGDALDQGTDDAHTPSTLLGSRHSESGSVRAEASGGRIPIAETIMREAFKNLFTESREGLATDAIRTAHRDNMSLHQAAAEVAPDGDADEIAAEAEEKLDSIGERLEEQQADDLESLAADVADELGMDKEEVMAIFQELQAQQGGEGDDPEDDPDDPDDEPPGDMEGQSIDPEAVFETDAAEETISDVVESQLDERLGDIADLDAESLVTEDDLAERFDDLNEELSDEISEQFSSINETISDSIQGEMETNETSDPSGGNATSETDLEAQIDEFAEDLGAEVN